MECSEAVAAWNVRGFSGCGSPGWSVTWLWSGGNTGTLCNQMSATYLLPSRRKVYLEWV